MESVHSSKVQPTPEAGSSEQPKTEASSALCICRLLLVLYWDRNLAGSPAIDGKNGSEALSSGFDNRETMSGGSQKTDDFESSQTFPNAPSSSNRHRFHAYRRTRETVTTSGVGALGSVGLHGICLDRAVAAGQTYWRALPPLYGGPCAQQAPANVLESASNYLHLLLRSRDDRNRMALRQGPAEIRTDRPGCNPCAHSNRWGYLESGHKLLQKL